MRNAGGTGSMARLINSPSGKPGPEAIEMNVVVIFPGAQVKGTDLVKVRRLAVPRSDYSNFW